ncbi:KAT8 regulatory NSL complex subunit 3 [Tanacetum coccineum]
MNQDKRVSLYKTASTDDIGLFSSGLLMSVLDPSFRCFAITAKTLFDSSRSQLSCVSFDSSQSQISCLRAVKFRNASPLSQDISERKPPPKAEKLVEFHSSIVKEIANKYLQPPLILVGKSMGSSCMVDVEDGAKAFAVVCLGYPLKGTKGAIRDAPLLQLEVPTMFVQSTTWRSADDSSLCEYTLRYSMNKGEQIYSWKHSVIDRPYNDIVFDGLPHYKPNRTDVYKVDMVVNVSHRTADDHILRELQNNPYTLLQVVHILSNTANLNTEFFAFQSSKVALQAGIDKQLAAIRAGINILQIRSLHTPSTFQCVPIFNTLNFQYFNLAYAAYHVSHMHLARYRETECHNNDTPIRNNAQGQFRLGAAAGLSLRDYTDWDGVNRRTDELTLYQVYNWRLMRIMDYLCFVDIFYVKGKGQSVHVSQIATRRLASLKDVVKRA